MYAYCKLLTNGMFEHKYGAAEQVSVMLASWGRRSAPSGSFIYDLRASLAFRVSCRTESKVDCSNAHMDVVPGAWQVSAGDHWGSGAGPEDINPPAQCQPLWPSQKWLVCSLAWHGYLHTTHTVDAQSRVRRMPLSHSHRGRAHL